MNPRMFPATQKHICKVVLLGESGCGKTSIMKRFVSNTFDDQQRSTIGVDFSTREIKWLDGTSISLQLWDTAGQERFQSISSNFYRGTHAFILVIDLTNPETFDNLDFWLGTANENSPDKDTLIYLVGNKCDLKNECKITKAELENYSQSKGLSKSYISSAKDDENIDAVFFALAEDLLEDIRKKNVSTPSQPVVKIELAQEEEDCCESGLRLS